jgi:quercetin dioxygenase-like cupin family protein
MERQPVHARWSELEMEEVRPGVRRAGFGTERALLVMNEMQPGMDVRSHSHDFDQIALITEGAVRFTVEGETFDVQAGEALLIPANAVHCGEPLNGERAMNLDVFAPAREDYLHLLEWMTTQAGS